MLLKLGMAGPDVTSLINDLRNLGFGLPEGSEYNLLVKKSVEAFQVEKLDSAGNPLIVDGKVGPNTRWALDAALRGIPPIIISRSLPPMPKGGTDAGRSALSVALAELEERHGEIGKDNHGKYVKMYLGGLAEEGASWCAGFVSYCFKQALGHNAVFGYSVGAQEIQIEMVKLGHSYKASISDPPMPGDIITWRRIDPHQTEKTEWWGHVALVYGYINGKLWTIEGNKGEFPALVTGYSYDWTELVTSQSQDKFKGLYGLSRHP